MADPKPGQSKAFGCAVVLAIIAAIYFVGGSSTEEVTPSKPLQEASANELAMAFVRNQISAKDRFVDAPLKLRGRVTQIAEGSDGASLIYLSTGGHDFIVAKFKASERSRAGKLEAGADITALCDRLMYVLGQVTPQGCVFSDYK